MLGHQRVGMILVHDGSWFDGAQEVYMHPQMTSHDVRVVLNIPEDMRVFLGTLGQASGLLMVSELVEGDTQSRIGNGLAELLLEEQVEDIRERMERVEAFVSGSFEAFRGICTV